MKGYKLILTVSLIFGFLSLRAEEDYKIAISEIFQKYPRATLLDVYKSFFQDQFGPEHIVKDTLSVKNYLENELKNMGAT